MDKLSIEQLEHGRKRTLHNAEELVTDARILLGNERYARCYFLSEIAVEELGKYAMLVAATLNVLVGQMDAEEWKALRRGFRDHRDKLSMSHGVEELWAGTLDLGDANRLREEAKKDNIAKMQALYTDFYQEIFLRPSEIVGRDDAVVALALAAKTGQRHRDFERRIEDSGGFEAINPNELRRLLQDLARQFYNGVATS